MATGIYIRTEECKKNLSLAHKGKKLSENHKQALRVPHKGSGIYKRHSHQGFQKGQTSLRKGVVLSKEIRHKISINRKGKNLGRGDLSNNWRDGVSTNKKRYMTGWRKENQEKMKKYHQARNARKRAGGRLSIKTIQLIYEDNIKRYGTLTCYLCLKPIEFKKDCLEHKTPLSRGGTNEYNNLAVSHQRCNSKKRAQTEQEFRGEN